MRMRRVVILTAVAFSAASSIYLWHLYGQLKQAFDRQEQFIPTRIYSDVTRIAPPDTRATILERLKALAYAWTASSSPESGAEKVSFTLHPVDYPAHLIPEGHPAPPPGTEGAAVSLQFSGAEDDAALSSIEVNGAEVPELFLEPELVATLSRGGNAGKQIRQLIRFNDIPAHVWQAIIAIEDQHFLEHSGLDPRGTARAIFVNLKTLSFAQGGSTITQQLVKNLMGRRNKNIFRKINELFLSLLLEATFDKEKILERYLNEVYLGQVGSLEVHGVAEGAKHFFGKDLKELNLGEIALMAGLIRGPGVYSPYRYRDRAVERQQLVLKKMAETGHIAEAEAQDATKLPIRLAPPQTSANKAPYFTDFVKAELIRSLKGRIVEEELAEAGFRVYTTLDMQLNSAAQQAVAAGSAELERKLGLKPDSAERIEAALASVDHSTGFIRALIGGRSYAHSTFNRILNMKRQIGSTFKPIVYLTALRKGVDENGVPYGPGHPVEDAQWTLVYDRGKQLWSPKNYEKEYRGWIDYRTALAHSVNTTTAKLGWELGIPSIIQTARELGIESELPNVPSLSLGVAELSPIELLKVYATFANRGVQDELTVIRAITQDDGSAYARFVYHPKQIYDSAPVDLLTDMLQSIFTEGTAREAYKLGFDRPAAGKTGTTSHHRDSWFAGYTPQLTTVVWVGMDQETKKPEAAKGEPARPEPRSRIKLTGASAALPIWVSFMRKALDGEPPLAFHPSGEIVTVAIDRKSGQLASQGCPSSQVAHEKYLKTNEPKAFSCESMWPPSRPKVTAE